MSTFKWKENMNGKDIGLPNIFKCRICSKVKPSTNDHYSKKELKTFTARIAKGKTITGFSANLRCRHCSGENVFELLCQNCHITKSKEDFSYNQRTAAQSARCKACVNWQEVNEPGTETLPGPSMALHPDSTLAAATNNPTPGTPLCTLVNSTAQAAGDDDESSVWRTTHPSNNTMSVPTGTSARPTTTRASVAETGLLPVPEGFMAPTRMAYRGEDVGTESTPSNPYGSRPSSPVSAAIDIFAQFDPFSRRGVKASKAAVGSFDAAAASSAQSEVVTDVSAGDMWTTPMKKNSTETPTGYDAPDSSITTPASGNADAWTTVPTKNKKAGTTFTGYDNQGVAHVQIAVAPSTASSTWATTAASVTASTAFEENVASGRYGRPGRTTPLRETSGGGGAWFKSTKPPKGDTTDYGFETYAPADLAAHAPAKTSNDNGYDSADDM